MKTKIIKRKMNHKIIKKIIEIDKEFYINFDYVNGESWYFNRYSNKNEVFLLAVDKQIVGYFLFYNISEKLFNDVLNLKYSGDYTFPENEVNVKSNYYYIPSVLVAKKYREYSFLLLRKLKLECEKKQNLIAITISEEGRRMAETMLSYAGTVDKENNIQIFVKTVQ